MIPENFSEINHSRNANTDISKSESQPKKRFAPANTAREME